jgi:hypothetical protein
MSVGCGAEGAMAGAEDAGAAMPVIVVRFSEGAPAAENSGAAGPRASSGAEDPGADAPGAESSAAEGAVWPGEDGFAWAAGTLANATLATGKLPGEGCVDTHAARSTGALGHDFAPTRVVLGARTMGVPIGAVDRKR